MKEQKRNKKTNRSFASKDMNKFPSNIKYQEIRPDKKLVVKEKTSFESSKKYIMVVTSPFFLRGGRLTQGEMGLVY